MKSILTICTVLTIPVVVALSWMCANALSSSGTNMVPELVERMTKELMVLAPFTMKLRVVAPPEGMYYLWIGLGRRLIRTCTPASHFSFAKLAAWPSAQMRSLESYPAHRPENVVVAAGVHPAAVLQVFSCISRSSCFAVTSWKNACRLPTDGASSRL